jgi:hypothetical protein
MQPTQRLLEPPSMVQMSPAPRGDRAKDRQLAGISCAFQRHGGVATVDEVVRLMRRGSDQPISVLARWIVDRNVIHFVWQGVTLLPLFQFDRTRMQLNPALIGVMRELGEAFDEWEIALWFVTPNASTNGAAPVDMFARDPFAVLAAARTDRFVALGHG